MRKTSPEGSATALLLVPKSTPHVATALGCLPRSHCFRDVRSAPATRLPLTPTPDLPSLCGNSLARTAWTFTRPSTSGSTAPSRRASCARRPRSSRWAKEPPIWGFDGSSTNQAVGHASRLRAQAGLRRAPIRCAAATTSSSCARCCSPTCTPHPTNTRARSLEVAEKYEAHEMWFGIEQEYTFFDGIKPLGWPDNGFPAPQFGYYCGVGADEVFGRDIVEEHMDACLKAGLQVRGHQRRGHAGAVGVPDRRRAARSTVADHLWVARWLLYRIAEDYGVVGHARSQAGQGRLERRRRAHQLLDQGDARVATTRASRRPRRSASATRCTSPTTASASKSASPASTRPAPTRSSSTASPIAARRCASRGRWPRTRRATSKIAARAPTWIPYVVTRLITETVCSAL